MKCTRGRREPAPRRFAAYLEPRYTFALSDAKNWTALVVYLVTGIVATELAARARRRAREAAP